MKMMSATVYGCHDDLLANFNEDFPRPPVPGEEGGRGPVPRLGTSQNLSFKPKEGDCSQVQAQRVTRRHSDLDLGYEPEGCVSPTIPYLCWAESLRRLLDDQDGARQFRLFLEQEGRADLLDFWFACSGFRKIPDNVEMEKRLRLAKAIYRRYVTDGSGGVVSRQIKDTTKRFIQDCVTHSSLHGALFDQAQTEVQTFMEKNVYPLFLKSTVYLDHVHSGGQPGLTLESGRAPVSAGCGQAFSGHELCEVEESKTKVTAKSKPAMCSTSLSRRLPSDPVPHQAMGQRVCVDRQEYRGRREPLTIIGPQHEVSPLHLTHTQESVNTIRHATLPQTTRATRPPKLIHMDPEQFAAELISRLETVVRERHTQHTLEERLGQVKLEEEGADDDVTAATSKSSHLRVSAGPTHPGSCCLDNHGCTDQWRQDHPESVPGWQRGTQSAPMPHAHTLTHTHSHSHTQEAAVQAWRGERHHAVSIPGLGPGESQSATCISSWIGCKRQHCWLSGCVRNGAPLSNCVPDSFSQLVEVQSRPEEESHGHVQMKNKQSSKKSQGENITVVYYYSTEPVPFLTSTTGKVLTLGQFKDLLSKKGAHRFYFKTASEESDCGVVFEEIWDDQTALPIYEERIIGKVEKID